MPDPTDPSSQQSPAPPGPGPMNPRSRAVRRRIVDAARSAFLAEGFDVSMDAVAAAADTTKVTLYKHFGSKQALFIAVITQELQRAHEEPLRLVTARLATTTRIRQDLVEACRAWVAGLTAPEAMALRNLVAGELRRFPELGRAWRERGPERFHPVVAEALRRLVAQGELRIEDVDLAVLQLSGLVVSPALVSGAYGSPLDGALVDRLVVAGVDMFLTQYRRRVNA